MQDRRIVLQCCVRLKHRRQFLVLDLDQVKGVLSNVFVISRDSCHALATEADPIVGQDRHVLHRPTPQSSPDISPRDDGMHARDLRGRCGINADDAGVGVGTMKRLTPKSAREGHIRRIAGVTRRLCSAIHPGYWLSNYVIGGHLSLLSVMDIPPISLTASGAPGTDLP